jgi:hypothetical protein
MVFILPQNDDDGKKKLFSIDKNILWWIESDKRVVETLPWAGG